MRKPIAALFFAALAAVALSATTVMAQVVLPNLSPGSMYQIIFVTAHTRSPADDDISTYNTFVTNEANDDPILAALGVTWHAVASTATVNANVNAPSNNQFVFNTRANLVAGAGHDLYSGSLLRPVTYNQHGVDVGVETVATGSTANGTVSGTHGLGSTQNVVTIGEPYASTSFWLSAGPAPTTELLPLYALSDTITVPVPEPETFTLFALGLSVVGFATWRRSSK